MHTITPPPWLLRFQAALLEAGDAFFRPGSSWLNRTLQRLTLAALFLIGFFLWGDLLNWGQIPFEHADWYDITGPRLGFTQEALQTGQLPLHVQSATGMKDATDRFLSIPDLILSPQVVLLLWLTPGAFSLVQVLLLYTLGYGGLLLLRHKWNLSLAVFIPLFWLFNFNGHITAHLSVGHLTWAGYFLLPYFLLLLFQWYEGPVGWRWVALTAGWLALIFLQGSFHLYLACLLLLGIAGLFQPRRLKAALLAGTAAVLLSLFRIIPAALVANDLQIGFLSGFSSVLDLFKGLLVLVEPAGALETRTLLTQLVAWWEFDHYVGLVGALFVFGLGGWGLWRWRQSLPGRYADLLAPLGALIFLSIGRMYKVMFVLHIPLFTGERVSSRLLILPLVISAALAALAAQRWLDSGRVPRFGRIGWAALLVLLINDLEQHRELWKVIHLDTVFPFHAEPQVLTVANHADPTYAAALWVGLALSLLTLGGLIYLNRRRVRPQKR